MAYQVALLNFEGPLDLLLQLIERSELEASALSLSDLTEQYLAYSTALGALDPVEASRFTNVASQLLYLKSYALLGAPDSAPEELADLQRQLASYGHYRAAGRRLGEAFSQAGRSWGRQHQAPPRQPVAPPNLTRAALRRGLAESSAAASHAQPHRVAVPMVSLVTMIDRLRAAAASGERLSLQDFCTGLPNRATVTVAFLATLELWRQGALRLTQAEQFSIIYLDYA